jgi:hypothetical protein
MDQQALETACPHAALVDGFIGGAAQDHVTTGDQYDTPLDLRSSLSEEGCVAG